MRVPSSATSTAIALALAACGSSDPAEPGQSYRADFQAVGAATNPHAHLSGGNEVPANASTAAGQAVFHLSRDGTTITYRLLVANIENTIMAHIHMAAAGANGGIVVWLRPTAPPPPAAVPGRFDGVYATGSFTADDLVGGLAGQPLSALLDAMRAGNTYVNVHTSQVPGGEIRGQIRLDAP